MFHETIDLSPPQPNVEGPRGPFCSSKPRLTYVSLPPDYEPLQPLGVRPRGCFFSLCVDETGPKSREYASYARGWDEEMKRLWTTPAPTMNIFGPLLPRFQNVTRAFLSRIMMFFNPCRESVFHRFRFRFKCLGQILGRGGDYFATTMFNVCGFIIYF